MISACIIKNSIHLLNKHINHLFSYLYHKRISLIVYLFSISMFLKCPNTSWCLYAHRVPAGISRMHSSMSMPLKASLSMTMSSTFSITEWMDLREVQSSNARQPISFTLSGITMLSREVQLAYLLLVDYQYFTP